jgi:hypothetical protein
MFKAWKFLFLSSLILWSCGARAIVLEFAVQEGLEKLPPMQELQAFFKGALAKQDIDVIYKPLPLARSSYLLNRDLLDGELVRAANITEDHPNILISSKPFLIVDFHLVYSAKNKTFDESKLAKLKGIILLNSTTTKEAVRDKALRITEVSGLDQAFTMLMNEHADYVILADPIIAAAQQTYGEDFKKFIVTKNSFQRVSLYICVSKKNRDLLPRIESAISKASKSDLSKYKLIQDSINKNW